VVLVVAEVAAVGALLHLLRVSGPWHVRIPPNPSCCWPNWNYPVSYSWLSLPAELLQPN